MSRITQHTDVISDVVDGVMTLCHTGTTSYFELNETGAEIWRACAAQVTSDDLVAHLAAVYPEEDELKLRAEVDRFVGALGEQGLLRTEG
jgi:hypothetical protein